MKKIIKKKVVRKNQSSVPVAEKKDEEQPKSGPKESDDVQKSVRQYLNQEDFVGKLGSSAEELYQLFEDRYLNVASISQTSVAYFVSQLNTNEQRVNPKFVGLFCASIKDIA